MTAWEYIFLVIITFQISFNDSFRAFQTSRVSKISTFVGSDRNFQVRISMGGSMNYNIKNNYNHDEIKYRPRLNEDTFIPQAERYSTKDWWHNLKTMRSSKLFQRIRGILAVNTLWSVIVYIIYKLFMFRSPGSKPHALLGSALGLLLVFRTNTAYNRFWEGRKIWERIISCIRNASRFALVYSDIMSNKQLERILHLLIAFPIVLQEYVQGCRQPHMLQGLLEEVEMKEIDQVTNRPYFIVNRLSKEVRMIPETSVFTSRERERLFKLVDDLSQSISACERIVQTPVPLTYARHTSRFLTLWCMTLPPCIVTEFGWYTIPFTALVSWALFGIQEIGMMIEEPFKGEFGFRLEVFANTVRRDVSELLHVTHVNMYPLKVDSEKLKYTRPKHYRPLAVDIATETDAEEKAEEEAKTAAEKEENEEKKQEDEGYERLISTDGIPLEFKTNLTDISDSNLP